MEKYLPYEIYKEVEKRIIDTCLFAQKGYSSADEDEDTITGDFFGKLQIKEWTNFNYLGFSDWS